MGFGVGQPQTGGVATRLKLHGVWGLLRGCVKGRLECRGQGQEEQKIFSKLRMFQENSESHVLCFTVFKDKYSRRWSWLLDFMISAVTGVCLCLEMKNWVFADGTNEGQANGAQKSVGNNNI